MLTRLRLFGGWETVDTNINPYGIAQLRPEGTVDRGYGGARVQVGEPIELHVRVEDGGRLWRPAIARDAADPADSGNERHGVGLGRMAIVAARADRVRTLLTAGEHRLLLRRFHLHAT